MNGRNTWRASWSERTPRCRISRRTAHTVCWLLFAVVLDPRPRPSFSILSYSAYQVGLLGKTASRFSRTRTKDEDEDDSKNTKPVTEPEAIPARQSALRELPIPPDSFAGATHASARCVGAKPPPRSLPKAPILAGRPPRLNE